MHWHIISLFLNLLTLAFNLFSCALQVGALVSQWQAVRRTVDKEDKEEAKRAAAAASAEVRA